MAVNSDLQQPIPTSSGEIEQPVQDSLVTETSDVLQATKNAVADSSDMASSSSIQSENSNINEIASKKNLDQSSQDDRTNTEVPSPQLNPQQAAETEPPSPSKGDQTPLPASGPEASVPAGTTNGTSVPSDTKSDTTETSMIDEPTQEWCEIYSSEPNIWLGHVAKQPQCAFTIVRRKYTFSSMLVYMIMTTLFSRIYFFNPNISTLSTCSSHQELLYLNGFCLSMLFVSLIVQLILDSFNVHTRNSCILILAMFAVHFMLLLLIFGRISYCESSILDYVFPTLTLIACTGYVIVAILTVPKLLQ